MMAQMVQIWINQAAILLIFATFFKIYYLGGEEVRANDDVSVAIDKGEFVRLWENPEAENPH